MRRAWGIRLVAPMALAVVSLLVPSVASAARVVPYQLQIPHGPLLRGHIHLPDGPGPFATVLDFSPYWNTASYGPSDADDAAASADLGYIQDAGYAVAAINMRGTGISSGCTTFGGQAEWSDVKAVIEDLARQPWSTGNIGMAGISFDGWSQFMAMADDPPPALKAVVPMSGVIDLWSLVTRRGAPIHEGPGVPAEWWALTSGGAVPPQPSHAMCAPQFNEDVAAARDLVSTGDITPYFAQRDMRPHIAGSTVPALIANGMEYVGEGHELEYEGLWDLLRPDRTHLVLGDWGHGGQDDKPDWQHEVLGWLGHYLRGEPQTVAPGVVEYQDTDGGWHDADHWPPPATPTRVYLAGDGSLSTSPPAATAPQTFQSVDFLDAAWYCGPQEALYLSPPLAEDVLVAGNANWNLTVTSSQPGGNLVGVMMRAAGDGGCGTPSLGQDGSAIGANDVSRLMLDLRHSRTPGHHQDFPVARPTRVAVPGQPSAVLVKKGQRLVLGVSGGAVELEPDQHHPAITVSGGSVELPVVAGQLRFAS